LVTLPTGKGRKPLKRDPGVRKGIGPVHVGFGVIRIAGDAGFVNRKRGGARREAGRPLPGQALKGEPRERARLKHTGEIVEGGRRRSGREPHGRNVTREVEVPGVVALDGWVALRGKEPRESAAQDVRRKAVRRGNARARLWSGAEA